MLVYVATYPRCGSALLRDLIFRNWSYLTANGYGANPPPDHPALSEYRLLNRPLLPDRAIDFLTEENRVRIAADPEWYFVKTHELPFAEYFPGERAIQAVRHPGAAIVSHWRLELHKSPNALLRRFIEGEQWCGSWSAYHEAWSAVTCPMLRFRFEDIVSDQADTVRSIADFLGFDRPAEPKLISLTEARARNPERNPGEGVEGWLRHVTAEDIDAIWSAHADVARRFGYQLPKAAAAPA
jgi:hypothetical protein